MPHACQDTKQLYIIKCKCAKSITHTHTSMLAHRTLIRMHKYLCIIRVLMSVSAHVRCILVDIVALVALWRARLEAVRPTHWLTARAPFTYTLLTLRSLCECAQNPENYILSCYFLQATILHAKMYKKSVLKYQNVSHMFARTCTYIRIVICPNLTCARPSLYIYI